MLKSQKKTVKTTTCGKKKVTKKTAKKRLHTRTDCLSLAQRLCKLRDLKQYGVLTCITCGAPLEYGTTNCQGGHYWSRLNRAVETEPDNIHPQCASCNVLKNGNHPLYSFRLEEKIGKERKQRIDDMARAREGDFEALERLSIADRSLAMMKKTAKYYDSLWHELNDQVRALEKELRV